jgi:hypothetical protein
MARKKKAVAEEEKRDHTVVARLIPLYGVQFEDDRMRHILAFGRTPEEAAKNARNAIQRHLPSNRWNTYVELANPETFVKAGVEI